MLDDAVQNVVRKGSWCQLVMLGRFNHVLVVPDNGFELLLDGFGHLGGEPDIGFQKIGEKFVGLLDFLFDVVEVFLV